MMSSLAYSPLLLLLFSTTASVEAKTLDRTGTANCDCEGEKRCTASCPVEGCVNVCECLIEGVEMPVECRLDLCCDDRRLLQESATAYDPAVHELDELTKYQVCEKMKYDIVLHVDNHLLAAALPDEDAVAEGCPTMVTHAQLQGDHETIKKQLLVWDHQPEDFLEYAEGSYPLGQMQLSEFLHAYENAEVGVENYDVIDHNCADYMISFVNVAGIKINSGATKYVARRLLGGDGGKKLVKSIRNSASFLSLLSSKESDHKRKLRALSDDEVVEHLVEHKLTKQHP